MGIGMIDYRVMKIPNHLNISLIMLGIGMSLTSQGLCSFQESILGGFFGFFLGYFSNRVFHFATGENGLGMGDIKLVTALGTILGWHFTLWVLFIAASLCVISGVLLKLGKNQFIAFGPFISIAAIVCVIYSRFDELS
jgi:leader peptidase (prepilin peptidase)/N-methyltransferase